MAKDSNVACGHLHSIDENTSIPMIRAAAVVTRVDAALQTRLRLMLGDELGVVDVELTEAAVA